MGRLIIYTSSQNTLRGRGEKYRRVIIHLQVGEAGYSITLVQIYNALATVGPRSTGTALSAARHLAHLTNLVSWATHLYLSPEHELFQLPPPPRHYQAEKLGSVSAAKKYMLPSNHYGGALVLTEDDGEFSVSHEHPGDESGTCSCR